MLESVAAALRAEAELANERRLLVLAGESTDRFEAATRALSGADVPLEETTLVGHEPGLACEHVDPSRIGSLLGRTREAVVVDCHEECRPNVLGGVVGAVNGGGVLVLLTPPLEEWPNRRDAFDETLAVPPETIEAVTGRFRRRLVSTLRAHPGIAIVDLETSSVLDDGLTEPEPNPSAEAVSPPTNAAFPAAAYRSCLTRDQVEALSALEALRRVDVAAVLSADRGRGKSSAAGLAAASLAAVGTEVLVTAPTFENATELFARGEELLDTLGVLAESDTEGRLDATGGGCIHFEAPVDAASMAEEAEVVIVDEAAALPVRLLTDMLAARRIAFATTVHGYEGTGRGFDVRFRDRLAKSEHSVVESTLSEPIRYAPGDPVEIWAFRALLLDAGPPVDQLVENATPGRVEYRELTPAALAEDEHLLRESFGLLVYAHYRTEPDDLARLLDAPNLSVRALCLDDHVVSVALLAREGGLDAETCATVYEGSRIRGNMLPDVLMSQLRDEDAGQPVGLRVVRIATHDAVRSRGLGSALLEHIEAEFADIVDWLGVGYGATPELLRFWERNGYGTIHLATTRNESSGEYSALMLKSTSDRGKALASYHSRWFARRILDVLPDALRDLDVDIVRATLGACPASSPLHLAEDDWRLLAAASFGPALYSVDPAPFRQLVLHHLTTGDVELDPADERLLVAKLLQLLPWPSVAEELDYVSPAEAMRSLGRALQPLIEEYGGRTAMEEADRYRDG